MGVTMSATNSEYEVPPRATPSPLRKARTSQLTDSPRATVVEYIPKEYSSEKLEILNNIFKISKHLTLKEQKNIFTPPPHFNHSDMRSTNVGESQSFGVNLSNSGINIEDSDTEDRVNIDDESESSNEGDMGEYEDSEEMQSPSAFSPDMQLKYEGDSGPDEEYTMGGFSSVIKGRRHNQWEQGNNQVDNNKYPYPQYPNTPTTPLNLNNIYTPTPISRKKSRKSFHTRRFQSEDLGAGFFVSPNKPILKSSNLFLQKLSPKKSCSFAANLHIINNGSEDSGDERKCEFKSQESRKCEFKSREWESKSPKSQKSALKLKKCEQEYIYNSSNLYPIFVPIYLDGKTGQPLRKQEFEPFSFDEKGKKVKTEENIGDLLNKCSEQGNKGNPMLQLKRLIQEGKVDALFRMEKIVTSFESEDIRDENKSEDPYEEEEKIVRVEEIGKNYNGRDYIYTEADSPTISTEHIQQYNNDINHKMKKNKYF